MGDGKFEGGKLTFLVSAAYALSANEKTEWQTALQNSSNFLYSATGGQVQFGDIFIVDDGFGRLSADVVLFNGLGLNGGTRGEFGTPGAAVRYYFGSRGSPSVFVHELAHHVWDLGDEYSGPMRPIRIDRSVPASDRRTIPVLDPLSPNALVGQAAIVRFSEDLSARRTITSNTATRVVVLDDFPDLPTNSFTDAIHVQDMNTSCGALATSGSSFCIMESSAVGVVDFCQASNHDFGQQTDQQALHGSSCWEKIVATTDFAGLTVPTSSPASPPDAVTFVDVLKETRLVLAIDRSGSMAGDQLAYAREGARYWIDSCALADDLLSVIAYNQGNTIVLPLTQMGAIQDRAALMNSLDAVTATGHTNIRDALREGVTQITSVPGRAVSQAVVVLTDGKHNRPLGSRLTEAVPDLVANRVLAMTIAIGEGPDVDAAELDDLAYETGGAFALAGVTNPIEIETALIEANLYVRGGLLDSQTFDFVPGPVHNEAKPALTRLYKRRKISLEDVTSALKLRPLRAVKSVRSFGRYATLFQVTPVYIEKGCERMSCAINHSLNCAFDIFLVNPAGDAVAVDGAVVRRASGPTHTLLTVEAPAHGIWRIVVLARRLEAGRVTTVNVSVGAENRRLIVSGGCTRSLYGSNERPRLFARATWDCELTGLHVEARVKAANGAWTKTALADGAPLTASCGRYIADLPPLKEGHYSGVIALSAAAQRPRADELHMAMHTRASRLSGRTDAPRFERRIPIRFAVTKRR